jgi:hypothetical protein
METNARWARRGGLLQSVATKPFSTPESKGARRHLPGGILPGHESSAQQPLNDVEIEARQLNRWIPARTDDSFLVGWKKSGVENRTWFSQRMSKG